MDNEGRVFTTYSCKGNVGKERPILAAVPWGAGRTPGQGEDGEEWGESVILASTGRARRRNQEILIWIV